ncbi:hypothetical protein D9756_007978 [Leucocoprinus leucothites]|uniref:Mitochondrial ribosomal protein S19 n=1 Tax=Leucocoprinus leucothites TaxID=201217 RepID=A0A8H5FXX9_9AGAR|nr:hypothetical protein D9756_007978 [Leucoagaricus leucothites]
MTVTITPENGTSGKQLCRQLEAMRPTLSLLKSGRSAWKGPYFVAFPNLRDALLNHVPIETKARSCTILPSFVGVKFMVHNGKDYLPVTVTQDMVGHKLGEFAHTKKRFTYKASKNR